MFQLEETVVCNSVLSDMEGEKSKTEREKGVSVLVCIRLSSDISVNTEVMKVFKVKAEGTANADP